MTKALRAARWVGAVAVASAGLGLAPAAAQAAPADCTWTYEELPAIDGSHEGTVSGGDPFGVFFAGESLGHAVLWHDGALVDRGAGHATDANTLGVAVGQASGQAVLWRANGTRVALATPAGFTGSSASAVNNAGTIVGTGRDSAGRDHGLTWTVARPSVVRDLGTAGGGLTLADVGEDNTVVGTSTTSAGGSTALIGTPSGGFTPLAGAGTPESTQANAVQGRYVAGGQNTFDGVIWRNRVATRTGDDNGTWTAVNSSGLAAGSRPDSFTVVWRNGVVEEVGGRGSMGVVTEDGRIGGSSDGIYGRFETPVVWTCG